MHDTAKNFFFALGKQFPGYFEAGKMVLDCGSKDINGTLREVFPDCQYDGLDKEEGKNVNFIGLIHEFTAGWGYDAVISCSTLEHSEFWEKDLRNMYRLLRDGGLLVIATVCKNFPEHGTARKPEYDNLIYGTSADYYRNINAEDVRSVLNLELEFEKFDLQETEDNDLFFWGIKKIIT